MTRSKYIKIIPDSKPMKAIRQKLPVMFDLNQVIRLLYLPPSRAELMKAYQKGWDDRKAYEVANAKQRYDYLSMKYENFFPIYEDARYYRTYPINSKKSWKAKK